MAVVIQSRCAAFSSISSSAESLYFCTLNLDQMVPRGGDQSQFPLPYDGIAADIRLYQPDIGEPRAVSHKAPWPVRVEAEVVGLDGTAGDVDQGVCTRHPQLTDGSRFQEGLTFYGESFYLGI